MSTQNTPHRHFVTKIANFKKTKEQTRQGQVIPLQNYFGGVDHARQRDGVLRP